MLIKCWHYLLRGLFSFFPPSRTSTSCKYHHDPLTPIVQFVAPNPSPPHPPVNPAAFHFIQWLRLILPPPQFQLAHHALKKKRPSQTDDYQYACVYASITLVCTGWGYCRGRRGGRGLGSVVIYNRFKIVCDPSSCQRAADLARTRSVHC